LGLAVFVIGVIWFNRSEAIAVLQTLRQGVPLWIMVATVLQCLFFVAYAALYQTSFIATGVPARIRRFLPLWFASVFVNTVVPPFGFTVFMDDAVRRGFSGAKATIGIGVVRATDVLTFGFLLLIGFLTLSLHHALKPYHVIAASILSVVILIWTVATVLALRFPTALERLFSGIERALCRTPFRKYLPFGWAHRLPQEMIEGLRSLFSEPRRLMLPFVVAMLAHIIDIAGLAALFPAFHQGLQFDVLLSGFGVGVLFWMVSLTPEGIGTVESVMAVTFTAQGVPSQKATAIALAFRGLTYYLPLVLGLIFVRTFSRESVTSSQEVRVITTG
jgi:hypothetical protein